MMKFKAGQRRKAIEYENDLVRYWKEHGTFEKSVEQRPKDNAYVFYDGPPFITGVPHHGTLLSSVVKDAIPRYWTMQGKRVERVWGWDCHGLPAEVFTEKKLGIHDKRDIGTKISLEEYITTCRDNMVATGDLWESTIDRIGRWVNFRGAYKTMDKEYMESVWWAFKQLYEKGKIYEGEKVLLYCTRDATPISKAEVAMDNSYQDVTDPSVYVKFKLEGEDTYLLAWTTTPWTLPANTAVGVGENETYSEVKLTDGTKLILLAGLLNKVLTDEKHQPVEYEVIRDKIPGRELVGKRYEPLLNPTKQVSWGPRPADGGDNAYKVWNYPGLDVSEGTGVVHLAPAYGEEDYELSRAMNFPFVSVIDDNGFYTEGAWQGQYVWDANKPIAKELHERGVIWKVDYIRHSYPHCHRCGTKLMYRAHPSWFMDIDGQRAKMLEENGNINWFPPHIKQGRFAKTVQSAPDWNLSRDRFWATAIPVWKGKDDNGEEKIRVVGSYQELAELSGVTLDDYHRPWVDDVTFTIDGVEYRRIDKVMDSWFEAGSMPYAQFHYPFENVEKFEQNFPGDFIAEYVGQVRAWFYYLHALSVGLWDKNTFTNVIVTGTIAGNDGRKMSKSYGNYTDPNELMDLYSADALRFLFLSSPLLNGEDFSLIDKDVADIQRKLAMIWNMYDFFTTYAAVDKWEFSGELIDPIGDCNNPLDIWILSRLNQLIAEVTQHMEGYDVASALKPILPFIDDASNWYVRRSRRRFWKSEDTDDKQNAYRTLHYVLSRLAQAMAPFTPFLADELFQKLTGAESVHLTDWPQAGHRSELVLGEMAEVRDYVNQTLAIRAANKLKVRQPLALLTVPKLGSFVDYAEILTEEVNVKAVEQGSTLELDISVTPTLRQEGQAREIIRFIQAARKKAGLQVDDRISLYLYSSDKQLQKAIEVYKDTIAAETLAANIQAEPEGLKHSEDVVVDGLPLSIKLSKA